MLVERKSRGLVSLLVVWLASAAAMYLSAMVVPGVTLGSFKRALVAALVLGIVNALVRPVLIVLTLPATLLTLGLFLLVINAAVVGLAAYLVRGFEVSGFIPALLMSIVLTVVSGFFSWLLEPKRAPQA